MARAGFTPGSRDIRPLLELLSEPSGPRVKLAERALSRADEAAARVVIERFESTAPPARARIVSVIGRISARAASPILHTFLIRCVRDADAKTRQRALSALGRTGDHEAVPILVTALREATTVLERKAAAEALGKLGGPKELEVLEEMRGTPSSPAPEGDEAGHGAAPDAELSRVVREATLRIERSALRASSPSTIDLDAVPARPLAVLLHVRAGLEAVLTEELQAAAPSRRAFPRSAVLGPRHVGRGRVRADLVGPLRSLLDARTFLHLGFPLAPVDSSDPDEAAFAALTSEEALHILRTFTRGPLRYRLEWAGSGHRRGATYRMAEAVAAARPELINDPRDATWQVVVSPRDHRTYVELWPSALDDTRFAYRVRAVPGSSHPTLAAALARIGGVEPDDIVWDPFVGAATELIERARLGPYRFLYGSDVSEAAVAAARDNLAAAGIARNVTVFAGDARQSRPDQPVTLVVTNPPLGRRVLEASEIDPLLARTLTNIRGVLAPRGRMVWVAPHSGRDLAHAQKAGFRAERRVRVDMGGFEAEIQLLRAVR